MSKTTNKHSPEVREHAVRLELWAVVLSVPTSLISFSLNISRQQIVAYVSVRFSGAGSSPYFQFDSFRIYIHCFCHFRSHVSKFEIGMLLSQKGLVELNVRSA